MRAVDDGDHYSISLCFYTFQRRCKPWAGSWAAKAMECYAPLLASFEEFEREVSPLWFSHHWHPKTEVTQAHMTNLNWRRWRVLAVRIRSVKAGMLMTRNMSECEL